MKKILLSVLMALAASGVAVADDKKTVSESTIKNYDRCSVYTFLVKSDKQNAKLDEEVTTSANVVTDIIKSVKKTKADTTGLQMSQVPQTVFPTIEIPDQFNDHNLTLRVLDVDALFEGLTDEQVKSANEEIGVKQSKGKKLLGGLGKAALGNDYTGYFLRLSKKK